MTDKPKFETSDITAANIAKLAEIFPCVVAEGKVNVDLLRSYVGEEIFGDEAYEFTWVGKRAAIAEAGRPIRKTLRPCVEESKNWDTTENLYIEGDNLDVLKLLQESYLGKVKMIYIDPPYNTGNDFIYRDNFSQSREDYEDEAGVYDEDGDRLFRNTETNGRFHSDWCNMIYPRLVLARNVLADDGVVYISISEEEVHTLKQICNEIFGESNFRNAIFTRRYDKNLNRQFMEQGLSTMNTGLEYILMYSRIQTTTYNPVFRPSNEERASQGYWKGFWNDADRPTMRYDVLGVMPSNGQWKWKRELAEEAVENYILFVEKFSQTMTIEEYWESSGKSKKFIRRNPNGKGKNQGVEHWVAPADGILRNTNWSDLLASKPTGVDVPFDSPKNVDVLVELIRLSNVDYDGVVLDFFSGSATTAHAVMQLNAEDGGKRKFIMVQLPEVCADGTEAYKAEYKNICEIGKERIRRAGEKIVSSCQFSVVREEMIKHGCIKLPRPDCLAESDGINDGDLQVGKKTAEGGIVFPVGSDEAGSGVNSLEYSGGTGQELKQGVRQLSFNSERGKSGTGNATANLCESRISCKYGYFGSDTIAEGNRQNAECPHFKTENCPLKTENYPGIGFRVLKLDDTNMNDVYYAAGETTQDMLPMMESNIKPDRTDMDLLFGCLLDWGLPLSMPHTREWLVDSDKWLEIEKDLKNNGCHKLHRFDGLAESNGVSGGSVSVSEETAKRGVVCIVGSNAASCSFNSFKHSGRASAPIDNGVYKLSVCVTGGEGGTGNTTACVRESGLPCRFGYNNSNAISSGSGQNAECPHENTNHCPLNTNHLICVHTYNSGDLIACFEERISEKAIREIAWRKPLRAVFRDSGFTSSPEKINVFEIFKLIAPNTNVRVI